LVFFYILWVLFWNSYEITLFYWVHLLDNELFIISEDDLFPTSTSLLFIQLPLENIFIPQRIEALLNIFIKYTRYLSHQFKIFVSVLFKSKFLILNASFRTLGCLQRNIIAIITKTLWQLFARAQMLKVSKNIFGSLVYCYVNHYLLLLVIFHIKPTFISSDIEVITDWTI